MKALVCALTDSSPLSLVLLSLLPLGLRRRLRPRPSESLSSPVLPPLPGLPPPDSGDPAGVGAQTATSRIIALCIKDTHMSGYKWLLLHPSPRPDVMPVPPSRWQCCLLTSHAERPSSAVPSCCSCDCLG